MKEKLPRWRVILESIIFFVSYVALIGYTFAGAIYLAHTFSPNNEFVATIIKLCGYTVAGGFPGVVVELRKDQWGWVGYYKRRRKKRKLQKQVNRE